MAQVAKQEKNETKPKLNDINIPTTSLSQQIQLEKSLARLCRLSERAKSEDDDVFDHVSIADHATSFTSTEITTPIFEAGLFELKAECHVGSHLGSFMDNTTFTTPDDALRWPEPMTISISWEPSDSDHRMFGDHIGNYHLDYLGHAVEKRKPVTINKFDLETVLDLNHKLKKTLKKQNKQFVEFKDKTDHWETTILSAFNTKKQSNKALQGLSNSMRCVMGSTFNWSGDWHTDNKCGDCYWLGVDGLNMFTNFSERVADNITIEVTSRDGFEHYKALWEYHMNSEHFFNGSVSKDVLK